MPWQCGFKGRKQVKDEHFTVLSGDDIIKADIPCITQLPKLFEKYNKSAIAIERWLRIK
jgi:UTP-glucose-1-phosphate uridylyltransferase